VCVCVCVVRVHWANAVTSTSARNVIRLHDERAVRVFCCALVADAWRGSAWCSCVCDQCSDTSHFRDAVDHIEMQRPN